MGVYKVQSSDTPQITFCGDGILHVIGPSRVAEIKRSVL